MSEQEHHNDPLERLFREKAEEYDIEYNEDNWLKLKDRLDEADRQREKTIRRRWIAAAVVLAFAFLTYFTIENQMRINQLNEKLSEYQSGEQEQPTQVQESNQNNIEEEGSGSDEQSGENEPANKSNTTEQINQNLAAGGDSGNNKVSTTKSSDAEGVPSPGSDERRKAQIALQTIPPAERLSEDPMEVTTLPDLNTIQSKTPSTDPPTAIVFAAESDRVEVSPEPSMQQTFNRLSVGVVMGPDLSTAGSLSNFYQPGYEFGATVDYNLTSNLGISTGIIRSRVRYTAGESDYNPPGELWSAGSVPQQTTGDCVLLDIPLRLKYDFLHQSNSRFYATAGLSSYIMLNEEYQFEYGYGNSSKRAQEWSDKTGTRHWMSNASLSLGYEYDILRKWSLRAQPYLKVPLQEVGWGNVKLYSTGITFSLNYNI